MGQGFIKGKKKGALELNLKLIEIIKEISVALNRPKFSTKHKGILRP